MPPSISAQRQAACDQQTYKPLEIWPEDRASREAFLGLLAAMHPACEDAWVTYGNSKSWDYVEDARFAPEELYRYLPSATHIIKDEKGFYALLEAV